MALLKLFLLLHSTFFFVLVVTENQGPVVRVDNGRLMGTWKTSTKGRKYASFMGIPYAMPPVGEHRFRAPRPMKPWTGIWNATQSTATCSQYDGIQDIVTGGEDCLFLNVYTPNVTTRASLPTMVFIHGGAFMFGMGWSYDPSHLMDRNLIFVSMNYRLGPIGFLSTGDGAIPGNAGLKDQSLALRWVRDNIMRFGGNPNSVTLTGHSAGGASVHYHLLSSLSTGTFHRALSFSGSAFCPWAYAVKPLQYAKELAGFVGCPTYNGPQIADCLLSRRAADIVEAQTRTFAWKIHLFTPFTPTAEGPGSEEPFITEYPFIASKHMRRLPLMVSDVSQEGLYPAAMYQADPDTLPELNSRWDVLASDIFQYSDTLPVSQRTKVAEEIKKFYLDGRDVDEETFSELVKALSDRLFCACNGKFAHFHANRTRAPTYMYVDAYRAQHSLSNVLAQNDVNYGVSHGDDIAEIFPGFLPFNETRPEDKEMTEILLDIIYNFVSTGEAKVKNGTEWQPVQPRSAELPYLEIYGPNNMEMKSSTDFGNETFWSSLGLNEDEHYHDEN